MDLFRTFQTDRNLQALDLEIHFWYLGRSLDLKAQRDQVQSWTSNHLNLNWTKIDAESADISVL